jgi:DNA polymerase-3 subunit beta
MMSAVVPGRSLVEIARVLDDSEDPVTVLIQKNHLVVTLDHIKVTTQLLDGDFLDYRKIIPQTFDSMATVPKDLFEAGVERAVLLARIEKNNNYVRFELKGDTMKMEANSEVGNVHEKIPVKLQGPDITIAFNARYFVELLRYIDTEHIKIKFTSANSPCVVTPLQKGDDFLYLILPMRMM